MNYEKNYVFKHSFFRVRFCSLLSMVKICLRYFLLMLTDKCGKALCLGLLLKLKSKLGIIYNFF